MVGGHLQTIVPSLLHKGPAVHYHRERWELDDGDFIDVDWTRPAADSAATPTPIYPASQPIVVIFHGLEGNSQSQYVKSLLAVAMQQGWQGVLIHFRGCSGEPSRLPRTYYAGDSAEIEQMLARVRQRYPYNPLYAVGYSLGGNALLKWLGEVGHRHALQLKKAVAVSAPIDLHASAIAIDSGLNRILYSRMFVNSMRPKALALAERFPGLLNTQRILDAKTIQDMDAAVTSVLYGASSAADYYQKNACKPYLNAINLPTLIINAKNDPFMPARFLPLATEVSNSVTLDYQAQGGHVGFFAPNRNHGWLPGRIMAFLAKDG